MIAMWKAIVVCVFAAATGAYFAGTQFAVRPWPQPIYELWYSAAPGLAILALAPVIGFAVGRWWAVLGALGPLAVAVPLQLSGHVTPWHDPTRPLDTAPLVTGVLVAFTAVAVLARKRLGPRQPWTRLDETWSH
jgi:hypothetical protein